MVWEVICTPEATSGGMNNKTMVHLKAEKIVVTFTFCNQNHSFCKSVEVNCWLIKVSLLIELGGS